MKYKILFCSLMGQYGASMEEEEMALLAEMSEKAEMFDKLMEVRADKSLQVGGVVRLFEEQVIKGKWKGRI